MNWILVYVTLVVSGIDIQVDERPKVYEFQQACTAMADTYNRGEATQSHYATCVRRDILPRWL